MCNSCVEVENQSKKLGGSDFWFAGGIFWPGEDAVAEVLVHGTRRTREGAVCKPGSAGSNAHLEVWDDVAKVDPHFVCRALGCRLLAGSKTGDRMFPSVGRCT